EVVADRNPGAEDRNGPERRRDADEQRAPARAEVLDRPAARTRDALQLGIRVDRVRSSHGLEQRKVVLRIRVRVADRQVVVALEGKPLDGFRFLRTVKQGTRELP